MKRLLAFLFPITCVCCGRELPSDDTYRVCDTCHRNMPVIKGIVCQKCGLPLSDGGARCYDCKNEPKTHIEYIRSAARYEGMLRSLIHLFKYNHRDYLERYFGKVLLDFTTQLPFAGEIDAVVPVPLHWIRRYTRGYNQAGLIARRIADGLNKPLAVRCLQRKRYTRPQFKLTREERNKNTQNCFFVKESSAVKGKTILLVDDICTTGATLEQCARVLKQAGAGKVYAVTLARD